MRISDKRIEMPSFFWTTAFLLSSSNQSYSFPWLALCKDITIVNGYFYPLWKMVRCAVTAWLIIWRHHRGQWLHHILLWKWSKCSVTARLIIWGSRSYWNRIHPPFASVTTPSTREFEARHSHSIIESYLEYHRQGLDLPDSLECRHHSSLHHEDSG